ncbi:uncharacterized protein LOC110738956 [Chenopodium quinoa]|uniref:uncharacterized protein LOC110738956 n=1 Tax=Chenopodium quinoa TaxID=63459 RepID=UPI000B78B805|nr:uncharacterized protein LOC110738956 [Chenopodium quinoa]
MKTGYSGDRWVVDAKGYSIASGYKWLKLQYADVDWSSWVWNRLNIPRHRFICWMIMWKKIRVRAHLAKIGVITDDKCPLCENSAETVEHLFFNCQYTRKCCIELQSRIGQNISFSSLEDCYQKLLDIKGRFQRQVFQSCYAGLLYCIWCQRNKAVWDKSIMKTEKLIQNLCRDIYHRITQVMPAKTSRKKIEWFNALY